MDLIVTLTLTVDCGLWIVDCGMWIVDCALRAYTLDIYYFFGVGSIKWRWREKGTKLVEVNWRRVGGEEGSSKLYNERTSPRSSNINQQ